MALTGPQLEKLHRIILDAYDYDSLEQCLAFRLNIKLRNIVGGVGFQNVVFEFLQKIEQEGKTAGVLQSLKDDRPQKAELVAVCDELLGALKGPTPPAPAPTGPRPVVPPAALTRTVSASLVERSKQKMSEIEEYLHRIAGLLPTPDPDDGLLAFLRSILAEDGEGPRCLRAAFGFPKDFECSARLFDLVDSDEPSMQPMLAVFSHRVNMLMWRYGFTLLEVQDGWTSWAKQRADAIGDLCDQRLLARQPTLQDFLGPTDVVSRLEAIGEPTPDVALYAALRALDHAEHHQLPLDTGLVQDLRRDALDFLFLYLNDLLAGRRRVEDSSNAWWALRTGLCAGDDRFLDLLDGVSETFNRVIILEQGLPRITAVPEIYKPIRTACYTISNIQAILEIGQYATRYNKEVLHQIILAMLDRLLVASRSNQLYLASVHHEGLRNFLDYVRNEKLPMTLE